MSACRSGAASRLCPLSPSPCPAQKAPQSLQSQVHCSGWRVSWSSPGFSPGLPPLCRLARAPHPAGPRPLTCSQLQTFFRGQRGAQKMGDLECPGPSGAARGAVPSQRRLQHQSPGSLLPCNAEVGGALCSPRGGAVVFTGPVDQQEGVVKKVQRTEWTLAQVSSAAQRPLFCWAPRRAFRSQEPGVVWGCSRWAGWLRTCHALPRVLQAQQGLVRGRRPAWPGGLCAAVSPWNTVLPGQRRVPGSTCRWVCTRKLRPGGPLVASWPGLHLVPTKRLPSRGRGPEAGPRPVASRGPGAAWGLVSVCLGSGGPCVSAQLHSHGVWGSTLTWGPGTDHEPPQGTCPFPGSSLGLTEAPRGQASCLL